MNSTDLDIRLKFIRKIGNGTATLDKLRAALKLLSSRYYLCGMEAELIGDFEIPSDEREYTLFEPTASLMPAGGALKFLRQVDARRSIVIYIYPAERAFTQTEKEELECYAMESMLYLEQIIAERKAMMGATTQFITSLPNESGYLSRAMELTNNGESITEYSAMFFNLKGYGEINRRYGRETGDILLRQYADCVRSFVGSDGVVGHTGSDRFVALIRSERQQELVDYLTEGVQPTSTDEDLTISAVVGIWDIDTQIADPESIIRKPIIAYNQAKNVLRRSSAYVTPQMIQRLDQQKAVLENYEHALAAEEFHVFYQPKVDSRTRTIVGAEALVRWINKSNMIISPGIFIPALEDSGRILPLDFYVLRRACTDIRRWIVQGLNPVPISVNFSRKDLRDRNLAEHINEIVEEYGIDKKLIEIELTETVDAEEHGALTSFIERLYRLGIMTAIDDFGSGYSSLATLREFRVHTLKIDRSFVNADDFSFKDEIILRDIIHMAHELGMEVLTEGVEREDQLAFVNSVGCPVIQGYYFDKPLPRKDYEERLQTRVYP